MAHAVFSPSAASRWMTCPGSHLPSLALPDAPSSEYADEGTRLHDVAAGLLLDTGEPVTREDHALLLEYLRFGRKLASEAVCFHVERHLQYSDELHGTADMLALVGEVLHVADLKTGRGVQVEPRDNAQLMTYAWLAMVDLQTGPWAIQAKLVCLTIAQPTIDGPMVLKHWTCTIGEVLDHGVRLTEAIKAAKQPNAPFVPGDHCRWCKLKPSCPELTGMARSALALPALAGLAPAQLSDWLDKADLLQQFIDALRLQAHKAVQDGYTIPGYALKPKRATRGWADEEAVLAYARERKIRIFQEPKLMSPAMAEKAYPKGLPAAIAEQIVSVSSGTNLVRVDGPREQPEQPRSLADALQSLVYRT